MKDHENKGLESLTDTMRAANLHVSRTNGEGHGAPDTGKSSKIDEGSSLLDLAGELQNLIITNLHPSAAIALSQTNRHFNACVNLHRLPFPVVLGFLQEKESLPNHSDDYACYTCLRLKPRSQFARKQTRSPRGIWGKDAHKRFCIECGFKVGKCPPARIVWIDQERWVHCRGCEMLQRTFCKRCGCCDNCIDKSTEKTTEKIHWGKLNGEASEVNRDNTCENHDWVLPFA